VVAGRTGARLERERTTADRKEAEEEEEEEEESGERTHGCQDDWRRFGASWKRRTYGREEESRAQTQR